jgi:DNA-binding GntR family transcriptional regulator
MARQLHPPRKARLRLDSSAVEDTRKSSRKSGSTGKYRPSAGRDRSESTDPLYLRIHRILRHSILNKRLKPGSVLLESHLARIFGSSRAPVRQAIEMLRGERMVMRFAGRGHIVGTGGAMVRRRALSPNLVDIDPALQPLRKSYAWETIYEAVERAIIYRSVFGRFRVNEMELARRHEVSRTVARDVLTRIQSLGMLEKDERQHWTIVPLDGERLTHLYEIREHLEPAALRQALPAINRSSLQEMRKRLARHLAEYPRVSSSAMDDLEFDLHVRCLAPCPNKELLNALLKTRGVLTLSKHVLGVALEMPRNEPFMGEHLEVIDAMLSGNAAKAAKTLQRHLRLSRPKVAERLQRFRESFTPPEISFIR